MKILALSLSIVFCSAAASAQQAYSDLYVIPIAGHTPGANGTNWMSNLAIQNFQTSPLTVQIVVIESGSMTDNVYPLATAASNGSVTVPAGGSAMLKDLLNDHRGLTSTTGALLVGADRPFALTSRTYSMTPDGDTVGQTVPGAGSFLDNTLSPINLAAAVAYVPGLVQNGEFRTNLGFVAANASGSGGAMTMSVTLRNAGGAVTGTRAFSVPAGAILQMQFSARELSAGNFDVAGAEFRITSGSGAVVPYASVIDNRTADAVFVSGLFPQNATNVTALSQRTSLFRAILDSVSGAR
jgi:hypothetical protein